MQVVGEDGPRFTTRAVEHGDFIYINNNSDGHGGNTKELKHLSHIENWIEETELKTKEIGKSVASEYWKENPEGILRLVKSRNPWGHGELTGLWSDNSLAWKFYSEVAKNIQYVNADDGLFYMQWCDFCKYFGSIRLRGCGNLQKWVLDEKLDGANRNSNVRKKIIKATPPEIVNTIENPIIAGTME